ncbi:MAG: alpha/beta hydrolase [Sandaracinaceae bacterium]
MGNAIKRHDVRVSGKGERFMVFAHGFGCDRNMWRHVAPAFEDRFRVVLFDHVGAGSSDPRGWDPKKYDSLYGFATVVVEIAEELGIVDGVFVGHSVSAMIGVLAANRAPERFSQLVLVGPSPRYLNDDAYVGGFSRDDIDGLLDSLESNYLGWSRQMAPAIMGNAERPELGEELANSFCRMDPGIAKRFAEVTFLSDNREDLGKLSARALVMQCADDIIAPEAVGRYVHEAIPDSELVLMKATGHCPNLSAPTETIDVIRAFV